MLGLRRWQGVQVDLFQGDLTSFVCDAMVNAANSELAGSGCQPGDAVSTDAGQLPARWVIHAVGPVWRGGGEGEAATLASAYRAALREAERLGARHVTFPSISTGAYGYPTAAAAGVAMAAIKAHAEAPRDVAAVGRVTMVLFSKEDYAIYQDALFATFPDEP